MKAINEKELENVVGGDQDCSELKSGEKIYTGRDIIVKATTACSRLASAAEHVGTAIYNKLFG